VGAVALLVIALRVQLPAGLWPAAELSWRPCCPARMMVIWRYVRGAGTCTPTRTPLMPHIFTCTVTPPIQAMGTLHAIVDARRSLALALRTNWGEGAIAALLVAAVPDSMSRLVYFAAFSRNDRRNARRVVDVVGARAIRRGARCAVGDDPHVGAAVMSVVAGVVLRNR